MTQQTDSPDTDPHSEDRFGKWTDRLSRHRSGLAALSFAESTVLPIPLETIVAPLMIGHPKRSISIGLAIWLGCLVGASLFYFLGLWLRDPVVLPMIEWLSFGPEFEDLQRELEGDGLFWTVFLVSFSPAPMQLATLGTGAVGGNFLLFFAAIAASRGIRYFGLAILAQVLGDRIKRLDIPKRKLIPIMAAVLLIAYLGYQFLTA